MLFESFAISIVGIPDPSEDRRRLTFAIRRRRQHRERLPCSSLAPAAHQETGVCTPLRMISPSLSTA